MSLGDSFNDTDIRHVSSGTFGVFLRFNEESIAVCCWVGLILVVVHVLVNGDGLT